MKLIVKRGQYAYTKDKSIELFLGDANGVIRDLKTDSIDFALFDPPYKMEIHCRGFASKREYYKKLDYGTSKDFELTENFMENVKRVLNKVSLFSFCDKMLKFDLQKFAVENKFSFDELPICKKCPAPLTNNQWLPDREWGIHIFNKIPIYGNYRTKTGFWIVDNLREPNVAHPSVKPQHILAHILNNLTQEGDRVFDPYMGSGSTGVACALMGRKFTGCEISKEYFDLSCERIQDALNEKEERLI